MSRQQDGTLNIDCQNGMTVSELVQGNSVDECSFRGKTVSEITEINNRFAKTDKEILDTIMSEN